MLESLSWSVISCTVALLAIMVSVWFKHRAFRCAVELQEQVNALKEQIAAQQERFESLDRANQILAQSLSQQERIVDGLVRFQEPPQRLGMLTNVVCNAIRKESKELPTAFERLGDLD